MFGSFGWLEILVVCFVLVLFFGAKRIPEIARSIGQSMKSFKKGLREIEDGVEIEEKKK